MSETEIFLGDHKVFEYKPKGKKSFLVGFGVVECVGDAPRELFDRREGLVYELVLGKSSIPENWEYVFISTGTTSSGSSV